ncbi:hypothetical protein L2E82_46880 [Cichorium intybus]|uniref:Uncharacterized protein n=1 Tax=Cichorium intybus TaxID=13427 RepID=A0ACB8YT66_CICIN|nr:hypothetical protein L2E82_46880 [Cichorium intybus]
MVAAVSSTHTTPKPKALSRLPAPAKEKRAPLLPSRSDNNGPPLPRRQKSQEVTSRYLSSMSPPNTYTTMSSSSSSCSSTTTTTSSSNSVCTPRRRFPSPLISRTNSVTPISAMNDKRDHSTERRHPGNLRTNETPASAKMLTRTSARSLSVSFQGESFALPVSKVAKPGNNGLRNGTPERRKAAATPVRTSDDSHPIDKQRWPGRSWQGSSMTMSLDFTDQKTKLSGSGTASAVRALRKFMTAETKVKHNRLEIPEIDGTVNKLVYDSDNSDHASSDTESISSGSSLGNVRGGGRRAVVVPARFWQETINLLKRVHPESLSPPLSKSNKLSPRVSPFSPVGGAIPLPPSPSMGKPKLSPSLKRNGLGSNSNLLNKPSILNFSVDARRGKVGENKLVDAHALRLLHNKHLQWRFANAKVDAVMVVQQATAQKSLYNAWVTISKMWHSVISKRSQIQQLKQDLKLYSVLKKQMPYLDNWDQTEMNHSISLSGAIEALKSSSLCLPVLCGAKADVEILKDAIFSSVDVMQAISFSICSLATKVENVNLLASELESTTKGECFLLDQCKDLFSTLTFLEASLL